MILFIRILSARVLAFNNSEVFNKGTKNLMWFNMQSLNEYFMNMFFSGCFQDLTFVVIKSGALRNVLLIKDSILKF